MLPSHAAHLFALSVAHRGARLNEVEIVAAVEESDLGIVGGEPLAAAGTPIGNGSRDKSERPSGRSATRWTISDIASQALNPILLRQREWNIWYLPSGVRRALGHQLNHSAP
jgi:hypothetical protein